MSTICKNESNRANVFRMLNIWTFLASQMYFFLPRRRSFRSMTSSISMLLSGILCYLAGAATMAFANEANVCLVNEQIGYSDPANVYQCKKPLKCCSEYSKPSCCGSKPSGLIIQEQLTLWGGLFAILFTIASIVYCRKNDVNIPACVACKHCVTRFCCGGGQRSNNNDDDDDDNHHNKNDDRARQTIALKVSNGNPSSSISNSAIQINQQHNSGNQRPQLTHGWRNNTVNPMPPDRTHIIDMSRV